MQMLLIGLAEFDVDDWFATTIYRNYSKKSKQIIWFWEVNMLKAHGQVCNKMF
eukprot:m.91474 g.91474  ORF g.91474 m.91474 type:complete len:53 (+) comp13305_c0_seq2:2873-3031(+)